MSQYEKAILEAKRLEEDCLYSAKGHFEAADSWSRRHYALGLPAAVLAAVSGVSIFQEWPATALILSCIVAALATTVTFLNPQERANAHHFAGSKFMAVRNQSRFLREIELNGNDAAPDLIQKLKQLSSERNDLNVTSPQIPRRAFERARRGIESGEGSYAVDQSKLQRKAKT